jgi:hypothetical protein
MDLKVLNGGITVNSGTVFEDEGEVGIGEWVWTGGRSKRTKGMTALVSPVQHDHEDTLALQEPCRVETDGISSYNIAAASASAAKPLEDDSVVGAGGTPGVF